MASGIPYKLYSRKKAINKNNRVSSVGVNNFKSIFSNWRCEMDNSDILAAGYEEGEILIWNVIFESIIWSPIRTLLEFVGKIEVVNHSNKLNLKFYHWRYRGLLLHSIISIDLYQPNGHWNNAVSNFH